MSWRSPTSATQHACALPSRMPTVSTEEREPTPTGRHRAYFPPVGEVSLPRYDRARLPVGRMIAGPAIIEDESSTTVLWPGQHGHADRSGNLIIEEQG